MSAFDSGVKTAFDERAAGVKKPAHDASNGTQSSNAKFHREWASSFKPILWRAMRRSLSDRRRVRRSGRATKPQITFPKNGRAELVNQHSDSKGGVLYLTRSHDRCAGKPASFLPDVYRTTATRQIEARAKKMRRIPKRITSMDASSLDSLLT